MQEHVGFDKELTENFKHKFNHQAVLSLRYTIQKRFEKFLSDSANVLNLTEATAARYTTFEIEKLLEQYREISIKKEPKK